MTTLALIANEAEKLSAKQSRLFGNFTLRTSADTTEPDWTSAEALERRHDAFRLASAAATAERSGDTERARVAYRRAAELFEWLLPEDLDDESALLSAAFYQLAELPAMAKSILTQTGPPRTLLAAFLSADFAECERSAQAINDIFGNAVERVSETSTTVEVIQRHFVSALNIVVSDIRWGDSRVAEAHRILSDVTSYFSLSRGATAWLLASAFEKIARIYSETSLRSITNPLRGDLTRQGVHAIERYVRGAYAGGRPIAWPTQRAGLRRLAASGNFALCTPTGSGKTTVAEIAILKELYRSRSSWDLMREGIALYIVPSRSLAAEVEERLSASFSDTSAFPIRVVRSYGGGDISGSEDWLAGQSATVIICTQEKADGLMRTAGALFVARVVLVIVDEAHGIAVTGASYERALRLESLIARLRMLRGDGLRVIALSAVISGHDESLGRWVDSKNPDSIRVDYQSTRRLFGRLFLAPNGDFQAEYELMNGHSAGDAGSGERPRVPKIVPRFGHMKDFPVKQKSRNQYTGTDTRLRAASLWAAAHLSSVESPTSGAVLITVGSKIEVYAAAFLDYVSTWTDLPKFFEAPAEGERLAIFDLAKAACADYFGVASFEYRLLERGIVVHHGRLPISLQRAFVRLVEARLVNICVATSTLSEGVNLPFETILFPTLRGHSGKTGFPVEEIRNVIGRAGRPGFVREGRALVMTGAGRAFGFGAKLYQETLQQLTGKIEGPSPISPLGAILNILHAEWIRLKSGLPFTEWLELTASESLNEKASNALEDLDSLLGAALTELRDISSLELSPSVLEQSLSTLWQYTFQFAVRRNDAAFEVLLARAKRVSEEDSIRVRRTYRSGMRPRSADALASISEALRGLFVEASSFATWDDARRLRFFGEIVDQLLAVPQFDFVDELKKTDPDWREVLAWWMDQLPRGVDGKQVGRWYFLANRVFTFKFNWAFSSAVLMMLDAVPFDGGELEEHLLQANLPRVLQFVRDMVLVGLMDPVGALLMQRGLAPTRAEARMIAREYYSQSSELDDAVYSRTRIYGWIARKFEPREFSAAPLGYVVSATAAQTSFNPLRVRPDIVGERTLWREVAGYPVASSEALPEDADIWTDYVLDEESSTVVASQYLEAEIEQGL